MLKPIDKRGKIVIQNKRDGKKEAHIVEDRAGEWRQFVNRVVQIIELVTVTLEGLIGFRVLLKLIAANPANLFTSFIYKLTGPLVAPFADIIAPPSIGPYMLEVGSLFAMAIYAFAAWVFIKLLWIILMRWATREVYTYESD